MLTNGALQLEWECLGNDGDSFAARLTLRNAGPTALAGTGWTLYFNTCRAVDAAYLSPAVRLRHPGGDLFGFTPAPGFAGLAPGELLQIDYRSAGHAISVTDAPLGCYLVLDEDGPQAHAVPLGDPHIVPFQRPEQWHRGQDDGVALSTPAARHAAQHGLPMPVLLAAITPAPLRWRCVGGELAIDDTTRIVYAGGLEQEAGLLQTLLREQFGLTLDSVDINLSANAEASMEGAILLRVVNPGKPGDCADPADSDLLPSPEAYRLALTQQGALVCGASAHGVANGIQSLLQLITVEHGLAYLPLGELHDAPRYGYRGLMLDVARHFIDKLALLRIIDHMARYKLNTLHLHLSDDEGWRLAIAALPELTDVGARRGYDAALCASFGSGAQADTSSGSGYYSRTDFIDILRYARQRHITVLPEIDVPGHARAAIIAMQARHQRLLALGQVSAAQEYLLSDPDDGSRYQSVQLWRDNVICIAQPGCLRFIETVLRALQAMYVEAGATLTTVHTGGDEVPDGAWLGSPLCRQLMARHQLHTTAQLQEHFFDRLRALVHSLGLRLAGWEEMAVAADPDGAGRVQPNPQFLTAPMRSYVWHSAWGKGREDLAYRLANAGYPVVLCNADRLYLDLACAKDPDEPGYCWGGFPDVRHVLEFCPEDIYTDARYDLMGRELDPTALQAMTRLTDAGRERILGIQAQLWGEHVRDGARLDYLLFPRLLAVAERAWCAAPAWAGITDVAQRRAAQDEAWAEFSHRLGRCALRRLDSLPTAPAYRLPLPGAVLVDGVLDVNVDLPGLTLRYTVDGSEPDAQAPLYVAPVRLAATVQQVRIAAFSSSGRKGRSSVIDISALPSSIG